MEDQKTVTGKKPEEEKTESQILFDFSADVGGYAWDLEILRDMLTDDGNQEAGEKIRVAYLALETIIKEMKKTEQELIDNSRKYK